MSGFKSSLRINKWGEILWVSDNGLLDRDGDKPAIISANGRQEYHKDGKLHRDNDLPAIIRPSGNCSWYIHGAWIRSDPDL